MIRLIYLFTVRTKMRTFIGVFRKSSVPKQKKTNLPVDLPRSGMNSGRLSEIRFFPQYILHAHHSLKSNYSTVELDANIYTDFHLLRRDRGGNNQVNTTHSTPNFIGIQSEG